MAAQESGGFYDDGSAKQPFWTQQQRTQPEEETIGEAQIRCPSPNSAKDQELVFQQKVLGYEGLSPAGSEKPAQATHHVKED